ncbi:MAG: T9SS type A sorting domain-containing protein [Melioribacteraceae bacterium]|nr:T9SS type A sorting domain-containing protein [Melioribacteraceae bacterium]
MKNLSNLMLLTRIFSFIKRNLNQFMFFFLIVLFIMNNQSLAQTQQVVTFKLTTETHTPVDETVVLQLSMVFGCPSFPMEKISENEWQTVVSLPSNSVGLYKYCRNYMPLGAEEEWEERATVCSGCGGCGYRELRLTPTVTIVEDTVKKWRWWPVDGIVPEINTTEHLFARPDFLPQSSFQCGVQLPDFWWSIFSPVVKPTLDRIVRYTNANWVEYTPVPEITQVYPTPIIVREGHNGTPEAELIKIITESHKRGLKVFLYLLPWMLNVQDNFPERHDREWWIAYEAQWRPIMLYYARIAQQYDVEMLSFYTPKHRPASHAEYPVIDSLFQSLLHDVRSLYTGKVGIDYNHMLPDMDIYAKGDYLVFGLFDSWPFRLSDSKEPTVSEMLDSLRSGLDYMLKPVAEKYGKAFILQAIAASSYDGSVLGTPYWETLLYWEPDDPNYPVDLQEQADAFEAILQAISERDWIKGAYSFNYNYWNSLDKAPSIRSKPAEKVLAKWWRWIHPDNVHLTISSKKGGSVDPSTASYVLTKDTTITVQAFPDAGYEFFEWTGDVSPGQEKVNPLVITMNTEKNLIATFIESSTDVHSNPDLPTHYHLSQNYPNPFNPATTIKFSLPQESKVNLSIYNVLGQLVVKLINDVREAGYHSINWDASSYSSGIYFFRIDAVTTNGYKTFSQVMKMILIK